jgi:hypothetical protein
LHPALAREFVLETDATFFDDVESIRRSALA